MADIIKFVPKLVDGGKTEELERKNDDGLVLSCHCGQTYHEFLNGGKVRCSRCKCEAPIVWRWKQE